MGQFDWTPEVYLERIRAEIPGYDELQEQAVAAIPFPPERVLELGMGTGETTRRLIEAHPDAWVIGLDSSPDMVFRARQTYDDVQLARMEDPLPDGPWDLVISVLSVNQLDDDQKQAPLPPGQGPGPLAGHRRRLRTAASSTTWSSGAAARSPGSRATWPSSERPTEPEPRYHPATDGCPEEENFQRPARQAARQPQGRQGPPQQLPALPQPPAAAPGLPDLRHLRRA